MTTTKNRPDALAARPFVLIVLGWLMLSGRSEPIAVASESPHMKLAVSSAEGSGSTLADLLMTELAVLPGVTMLERAELDKVLREQALAGSSSAALVKAGALLGADGIVVLDTRKLASSTWIAMRVIGVRHGVALGWWDSTIPTEQTTSWSKGATEQIRQLLPKLTAVGAGSAAISFVGFASPSSSRSSTSLEREINALLLKRLGAEPDLLVLERQKLLDAAFEKILSGDDRKFWNGAYLLEGTINPERIEASSVSVHARLVPPGSAPVDFVVKGLSTNLAEVGTRFMDEIRQALHAKASPVAWDSAAEAKRFYDQAESATRWQFWPEAAAAADMALALGKDDMDTKRVRLEAYTGWFRLGPKEASGMRIRPRFGVLEGYIEPPSEAQFKAAVETAYQLRDLAVQTNTFGQERLKAVAIQATEALGRFTLRYYFGADLRKGKEEKLAALRDTMREFIDHLLQTRETANAFIPVILKFGPFWEETPEEGVKLHQRLRALPGFLGYQISQQASSRSVSPLDDLQISDWTPPLCGWKWADRSRVDQVWETYTNPSGTPNESMRPPKSPLINARASLPPSQILEAISQSVSNGQIPRAEILRQLRGLTSPADKERAVALLKMVSDTPPSPTNLADRAELRMQLGFLNFAIRRAHEDVTLDEFSQMRTPPELRIMSVTNCFGLNTGLRVPQPPEGSLSAKFVPLTQSSRAEVYQLVWAEDKLWIYYQAMKHIHWESEAGSGDGYSPEHFISAFAPSSGELETIQIPELMLSLKENKAAAEFAVFPERIILFLEQAALIYDRGRKSFSSVASPLKSAHVFQLGKGLLLYNDETILETSSELKEFNVLASVRRRPAISPLDNLDHLPLQLLSAGRDQAYLLICNSLYRVAAGRVAPVDRGTAMRSAWGFPEQFLMHEIVLTGKGASDQRLSHFASRAPAGELWWTGHTVTVPDPSRQWKLVRDDSRDLPPFPFLADSPLNADLHTFIPFRGQPITVSYPRTPGDAQLSFWRSNHWRPLALTVTGGGRPFDGSPILGNRTLVAGGEIFAWAPNVGGLWHIRGSEAFSLFEKLLDREEKRLAIQAQKLQRILAPYDSNKNGKLDHEEYAALAQEPALFNLIWCELDQDHNNIIDGDELVFFDFDHDGKLDPVEHQAFLNAVSYMASEVFPFLDKNGDGFLDESETRGYCGSLLSVPGIFKKFDKGGTGRLGLSEWTALIAELVDRRLASGLAVWPAIGPMSTANRQYFLEPAVVERYLAMKH